MKSRKKRFEFLLHDKCSVPPDPEDSGAKGNQESDYSKTNVKKMTPSFFLVMKIQLILKQYNPNEEKKKRTRRCSFMVSK